MIIRPIVDKKKKFSWESLTTTTLYISSNFQLYTSNRLRLMIICHHHHHHFFPNNVHKQKQNEFQIEQRHFKSSNE